MPLHSKKQINNGIVALWEIKENFQELLDMLPPSWLQKLDLSRLSKHNLAARVLANTVSPDFDILEKDEYGKPYFESAEQSISLTHSGDFAGFMLKKDDECGIDMEKINPRIERITSKFIREDEKAFLNNGLRGMFIVWCAKEAMYKYYGLKALDFLQHLKLDYQPIDNAGILSGHIEKNGYQKSMELSYYFTGEYIIVHTN